MVKTLHIIIIDGTLSRLEKGRETNAGLLFKLLREVLPRTDLNVFYHPGIQGRGWQKWLNVLAGIGINLTICAGYSQLARRYSPDDKILLFGFSRGAYAVRSLAGMIGRVGLLRAEHMNERRVRRAFRHYEANSASPAAAAFTRAYCHENIQIEMIGVWDTVKALGIPYPILNRIAPMATEFHDHQLGPFIANAYQALALDENRLSYQPILWNCTQKWEVHVEQRWFSGAHADIGGHLEDYHATRPLSNIPLLWMLEKGENCGLPLPQNWRARFETDPEAPMMGPYANTSKFFLFRAPRRACQMPCEALHPSVAERRQRIASYHPRAILGHNKIPDI